MNTTILIIEDDTGLRTALADNLRNEGFAVLTEQNGQSGLERARAASPDLIVLDLMLPGLDGLSVCRLLRKESNLPIIMISARGMEMDKITGLETGADDYVVKPFGMGELVARVKAALRRRQPEPNAHHITLLRINDLQIDLIGRRVFLDGNELHLTQKEFNLLVELVRNQGVVLSRDLLMTQVWGDDYVGGNHTVDVHIRWLREKIEANPSEPVRITTIRGIGYRFEQ
ncbi:MAG TPA: response regulator transcription factor [Anaerolineales bacterium]|nr:response regulator transcription factor [Anaerolineales bacterium]